MAAAPAGDQARRSSIEKPPIAVDMAAARAPKSSSAFERLPDEIIEQ